MKQRLPMVVAAFLAVACTAWASLGASTRWSQLLFLLLACLSMAAVVVLLPSMLRAKAGAFMAAFVGAAGVLPVFVLSPEPQEPKPNSRFTAELIRRGPFQEALPGYLKAKGLADVGIPDAGASQALDAVQLVIEANPAQDPFLRGGGPGTQVFAHMETYESGEAASRRAKESLRLSAERYSAGLERVAPDSFCLSGGTFWLCAGYRGLVYAEVTLSPAPNANLPMARGTLSSMLRYADDRARLATD